MKEKERDSACDPSAWALEWRLNLFIRSLLLGGITYLTFGSPFVKRVDWAGAYGA